jgi:hypothetical protein
MVSEWLSSNVEVNIIDEYGSWVNSLKVVANHFPLDNVNDSISLERALKDGTYQKILLDSLPAFLKIINNINGLIPEVSEKHVSGVLHLLKKDIEKMNVIIARVLQLIQRVNERKDQDKFRAPAFLYKISAQARVIDARINQIKEYLKE